MKKVLKQAIPLSATRLTISVLSADVNIMSHIEDVSDLRSLSGMERCVYSEKLRNLYTSVEENKKLVEFYNKELED